MKTLIEKILPVEEISEEAKKEKLGTAKPRTFELHYWWTRKPLVAARAAVLGALLPEDFDVQEFKRMLGLGKEKRAHNYNLENLSVDLDYLREKYREVWGTETPTVFDPFAGGGSIPFEALRVGCNAVANDYNPEDFD
jgi:putative DNA methylase